MPDSIGRSLELVAVQRKTRLFGRKQFTTWANLIDFGRQIVEDGLHEVRTKLAKISMKRFIRFRLRTLLLFMSVFGCIGGWLVMHESEYRRELQMIDEIVGKRKVPSTSFSIANGNVVALFYDSAIFG